MLLSSGGTRTGGLRLAEWDRGQNDSSRQDTPRLAGLQGFTAPSQPPASASRVSSTSGLSMMAVSMYDLRAGKSREQSQPTAAGPKSLSQPTPDQPPPDPSEPGPASSLFPCGKVTSWECEATFQQWPEAPPATPGPTPPQTEPCRGTLSLFCHR